MQEEWITKKVDKYVIVNKKLGVGTFGTVYRGFLEQDESKQIAVKTIPIKIIQDNSKILDLIKREINILIQLIDVNRTSNYLYIFLECCEDGDLKEYLQQKLKDQKDKFLSEVESVIFLKHIVEGFRELYKHRIIHRDIKPANILLNNGVAKITEFGFARIIETEMNDPSYLSRLGSPLYMAPQILEGLPFSSKCDIWSLGIMFYEMLYGETPWNGESQLNLLQNIKSKSLKFPEKPVRSDKVKELIKNMLVIPEKERISWEEIFSLPIMKLDQEKIKQTFKQIKSNGIIDSGNINKQYLDENLVIGYLDLNLDTQQVQKPIEMPGQMRQTIFNKPENDGDNNNIINFYNVEKKKKDSYKKYTQYFLFERNIAFFFNFLIQKLITAYHNNKLELPELRYYQVLYILIKNQLIHLHAINDIIINVNQAKFDKDQWGRYMITQQYYKIAKQIKTDIEVVHEFFLNVFKQISGIEGKFKEILNNSFSADKTFHQIYHQIINELIQKLKQDVLKNQDQDKTQLMFYLLISLNPYDEFKEMSSDFNKFYEQTSQANYQEILERAQQKKSY